MSERYNHPALGVSELKRAPDPRWVITAPPDFPPQMWEKVADDFRESVKRGRPAVLPDGFTVFDANNVTPYPVSPVMGTSEIRHPTSLAQVLALSAGVSACVTTIILTIWSVYQP